MKNLKNHQFYSGLLKTIVVYMEVRNLKQSEYSNAYGILCAPMERGNLYEGLNPTFCRVPLGSVTTAHAHFEPEVFYIVEGLGQLTIENETRLVTAGDLARIPPNKTHSLKNIGVEELVFLSVYTEDFLVSHLPTRALVTAAPPTPNGPLHLGHISGPYLAADIMTRFLRSKGAVVRNHSGTDDHQNYVFEKAFSLRKESELFRTEMRSRIQCGLNTMKIHFEEFIEPKKDQAYQDRIYKFFRRAVDANLIELQTFEAPFCSSCDHYLLDALIDGNCPSCKQSSRGGCEVCGLVVPPQDLENPSCARCHKLAENKTLTAWVFQLDRHLGALRNELLAMSLSPRLKKLVEGVFRQNDIKVLVTHPQTNSSSLSAPDMDQALHVWFEMAAHYESFALGREFWIHSFGFDNSFYYLLFIPALLRALNPQSKIPDVVLTNEFLLLDNQKFSTSRGHAIWADEFEGNVDHLRMYLSLNRPAQTTSNFSLFEFQNFSDALESKLAHLKARSLEVKTSGNASQTVLQHLHRFKREIEMFLSPQSFDLRRAASRLMEMIDFALQSEGIDGEVQILRSLAVLLNPVMPAESENILLAQEAHHE